MGIKKLDSKDLKIVKACYNYHSDSLRQHGGMVLSKGVILRLFNQNWGLGAYISPDNWQTQPYHWLPAKAGVTQSLPLA